MRNLAEYPVTNEEIIECLNRMADDLLEEGRTLALMGDMRPVILRRAATIVKGYEALTEILEEE